MPEWRKYRLENILSIVKNSVKPCNIEECNYIGLEHIAKKSFLLNYIGSSQDVESNKYFFQPNDILYGKLRPYFQKVYKPNFEGICSTDIYVIRTKDERVVSQDFLYQIVREKKFTEWAMEGHTGTRMPRADWQALRKKKVLLPIDLIEQHRIAEILGALDDKIELNLEMNKTLEEMAMAIYKEWFVDFGPFRDGEFVDSELGLIPKGWELKTINAIIKEIIDHRGKTPKKMGGTWTKSKNNTIPALSAKNIKNGTIVQEDSIRYIDRELYDKWMPIKLESGDILMTSEAPLGELFFLAVKEDYCLSQRLFALRTNTKLILPWCLFFWLKSYRGQHLLSRRATGSTVVGIRQAELRKVEILKPPIHVQMEQDNIINCIFVKMEANIRENQILKKTRDYLLPKLISGEIRVKAAEEKLKEVL